MWLRDRRRTPRRRTFGPGFVTGSCALLKASHLSWTSGDIQELMGFPGTRVMPHVEQAPETPWTPLQTFIFFSKLNVNSPFVMWTGFKSIACKWHKQWNEALWCRVNIRISSQLLSTPQVGQVMFCFSLRGSSLRSDFKTTHLDGLGRCVRGSSCHPCRYRGNRLWAVSLARCLRPQQVSYVGFEVRKSKYLYSCKHVDEARASAVTTVHRYHANMFLK